MACSEPDTSFPLPSGLAIDFGGTKIAAARLAKGKIIRQHQVLTEGGASVEAQLNAITELLEKTEVNSTDRIGLAVTGRVDRKGNWYALNRNTLSEIEFVPLSSLLSQRFGRQVRVINDATAAMIGEQLCGAAAGCQNAGYITVSTGVGGGFIIEGQPLLSPKGLAGHAGFMTSTFGRNRCGSGRERTVESIASGKAIARWAEALGHRGFDARAVYKAHLSGEKWASGLIEQSAEAIAELCANIKSLLDPEIIVLGGSIGLAQGYLALVQNFLDREPEIFRPALKPAALDLGGVFIGALTPLKGELS